MDDKPEESLVHQNDSHLSSSNTGANRSSPSQCRYVIDRPTSTQSEFAKNYFDNENDPEFSAKEKLEKCAHACNCNLVGRIFIRLFPIISLLRSYKLSEWLPGDLVAGLTVGVVHIPQSMAFSLLAGLPPVFGLYTSFYSVLLYTFMGTSRHISVGTFAVTSLLTQSAVLRITESEGIASTNMSTPGNDTMMMTSPDMLGLSALDERKVAIASTLMFLMGIFQLAFGILRLGFVTTYLSEPLLQAFTIGAAIHVATSQAPSILGLRTQSFSGIGAFFQVWIEIFRNIPNTHVATLIVSIVAIVILVAGREINIRFKEKMKIPLPTEVIVVAIAILASHFGMFKKNYGMAVVDNIPTGFPAPRLIDASILSDIVGDAFSLAIVGFAINVSLAKMYAQKYGYEIDSNQEFVAYGVSNIVPSFFACFPNATAVARCAIQDNMGGKTQVVGFISVIVLLLTILVLGPIFEPLPRSVLGSIIIVGLLGILQQLLVLKSLYKLSRVDFLIWVVTLTAVVVLGLDLGLLAGVLFSMCTFIARTQLPRCEVVANVTGTDIYRNCKTCDTARPFPGITIFKFHAVLYYANKDIFLSNLYQATEINPSLAIAAAKAKQEKIAKAEAHRRGVNRRKCLVFPLRKHVKNSADVENAPSETSSDEVEANANEQEQRKLHTIIIDCGAFTFIDLVGVKALTAICKSYKEIGICVLLADVGRDVRASLTAGGYYEIAGKDSEFVSVHDAAIFANYKEKCTFQA